MLLVLDVGNTNTVLGVFTRANADAGRTAADKSPNEAPRYDQLRANWRVATVQTSTVDEYGVLFRNLFAMAGLEVSGMHGIVISSVVPPLDPVLRQVCERYFNSKPLFIEPGIKTGMPVHYDNPAEGLPHRAWAPPPTRSSSARRACRGWRFANQSESSARRLWAVCSPGSTTGTSAWWMAFSTFCSPRWGTAPRWLA